MDIFTKLATCLDEKINFNYFFYIFTFFIDNQYQLVHN